MAKNIRRLAWLVILVVFVAFIVYSLANSYWSTFPYANYRLNDEVKGFPIDGMSITFTNYSITPDLSFPQTSEDVNVNVTLRNLTNQTLYLNQTAFQERLFKEAGSKDLELVAYINGRNAGGTGRGGYQQWWGITVNGISMKGYGALGAFGSVNGSIRYTFGDGNYTSFVLFGRSSSQPKPLFALNLTQG